jgi:hypothetical protein
VSVSNRRHNRKKQHKSGGLQLVFSPTHPAGEGQGAVFLTICHCQRFLSSCVFFFQVQYVQYLLLMIYPYGQLSYFSGIGGRTERIEPQAFHPSALSSSGQGQRLLAWTLLQTILPRVQELVHALLKIS